MKKIKISVALIMCIAMLIQAAFASGTLGAGIKGKCLIVNWQVDCAGDAVLTVYRNNWPVEVRNVKCDDGEAVICLEKPEGSYSIRLRTNRECLTAGVTIAGNTPVPEITLRPSATQKPQPTNEITVRPTVMITPVPTVNVTAKPTFAPVVSQSALASEVIRQVNSERAKYGLPALRTDRELTRAACVRAAEIVEKFSHTRPDGSRWNTVSASAYGENIAKGQKTADKVMAAWLTSDGHRANILKAGFGSIGVCAYVHNGITYWVQLFGR